MNRNLGDRSRWEGVVRWLSEIAGTGGTRVLRAGTLVLMLLAPALLSAVEAGPAERVQALWQSGERIAAHAVVDSVLPLARATEDTAAIYKLQILRGVMHTAMGDGARGELPLREGLALSRAVSDAKWEMTALRWLGVALGYNLQDEEAATVFQELLVRSQAEGNREKEAWAECGLGYQSGRAGKPELAREHYTRSVGLFAECEDVRGEIFALNGLGITLNQLSDFSAARECYAQTLAVSRRIGATYTEAMAENNLGTLEYSLGDPGRALTHFERSYDINLAEDNLREAINAARNIAVCHTDLGQYDRSLEMLDDALLVCQKRQYRDLEYTALTQKGLVLSLQGRPAQAGAVFAALAAWTDRLPTETTVDRVLGQAYALERMGTPVVGRELLLAHEADAQSVDEPILRLAFFAQLGVALLETGSPREALDRMASVVENARELGLAAPLLSALTTTGSAYRKLAQPDSAAAAFREAVAVWERERSVPLDPQWRERRGSTGRNIFTELADLILTGPSPPHARTERVRQAYELLQGFKARTLHERMVGPQRTDAVPPEPITLAELQLSLQANNEVLLDFFIGRRNSFVFGVTHDGIQVSRLAAGEDLNARVDLYRDLITTAKTDDANRNTLLSAGAQSLRSVLLDSMSAVLGAHERVIFCPDGGLNHLPLALLVDLDKEDAHTVDRVPSASILVRLRHQTISAPVRTMLAVPGGNLAGEAALAAAEQESRWLARRFKGVVEGLPDTVATATALAGFDLIHLASHARVSGEYPWRSTIAARTLGGEVRSLNAAEIAGGRLGAGLAVLAGCESAGGTVVGGEGVMGLGSAFIAAGIPAVVASLWPVEDVATYALMREFYEGLAADQTIATALTGARRRLAATEGFSDPVYWAGFVVIGDGNRVVDLSSGAGPRGRRLLFFTGIMLLCGAGLLRLGQVWGKFL